MKTIIVLGFGRSGTTWLSDIISKTMGTLILFEPFHPSVTEYSKEFSYSHVDQCRNVHLLRNYLNDILNKRHKRIWLMRNHVPFPLEYISNSFFDLLWKECSIGGFKEIRTNFMIPWFHENLDSKIVYIVRHPCAVIASIKQRSNFWEFGWPATYELFLEKTIYNDHYSHHKIADFRNLVKTAITDIAKHTIMWSITHAIAVPELERLDLPTFHYEDFYDRPFCEVKRLFRYLKGSSVDIHPSYIFTPSMTTMKTMHGLYKEEDLKTKGASVFWKNVLSPREIDEIMGIVNSFGIDIYDRGGFPKAVSIDR